jgi:rhodanese-related sulfurtransferase
MNSFYTKLFFIILATSFGITLKSQHVVNDDFQHKLTNLLSLTVTPIDVDRAYELRKNYIFLDTREQEEFNISSIPGAIYFGYDDPKWSVLAAIDKDTPIIVYCSVGYRSEKIGEQLKKKGFKQVFNLYGSIFEWINQGHPVVDSKGIEVNKIHTYNRTWSRWVSNTNVSKVW